MESQIDFYELIWLKLSVMINATELYIFMLFSMSLTLIRNSRGMRKQKFLNQLSVKVLNQLWLNLDAVETWAYCILYFHFMSSDQFSREKSLLNDFVKQKKTKEKFDAGLRSDVYRLISFQLGLMIDSSELYCLIPVWLTSIHSHGCMIKQKLLNTFSCKTCLLILDM